MRQNLVLPFPTTQRDASYEMYTHSQTVKDLDGFEHLDPLSPEMVGLVSKIGQWIPHAYERGQKLPTIAYHYHKTTTTWWIILAYNGLASRFDLTPGMLLKIPTLAAIQDAMNNNRSLSKATVVSI